MRGTRTRSVAVVAAIATFGAVLAIGPTAPGASAGAAGDLRITKAVDQLGVEAGEPLTYEIEVLNTGDDDLTGVTVTDAAAPDCDRAVGDLAAGAFERYTCSYTTTGADVGTFTNTAEADSDQTDPVTSDGASATVRPADAEAPVEYQCDNPLGGDPIVSTIDVGIVDDVDPADVGETVTWSLAIEQPTLDSLPFDVTVNWLRVTVARPANLDQVDLLLSDPPGLTANPATNLATETITPSILQFEVPNDGRKIVAKTDGSLVFPGSGGAPVVLPEVAMSAVPTAAAAGTTIDWLAPDITLNGTLIFPITVDCTPTSPTVLISTAVNAATPRVDVDQAPHAASVLADADLPYSLDVENTGNVPLTGVSLAVAGAPGCDRPALGTIAPGAKAVVACTVDPATALEAFAKAGRLVFEATVDAAELSPGTVPLGSVGVTLPEATWPDVAAWYHDAADWLQHWGLADGYADGTFRGNDNIIRGAFARMVYRLAGSPDTSGMDQNPFTDMAPWAADAMR
ncbi:MAG: S-layer homology domain-containing protein, partial [Actinomycetota bacterium]